MIAVLCRGLQSELLIIQFLHPSRESPEWLTILMGFVRAFAAKKWL